MDPLKILIADKEQRARQLIRYYLDEMPEQYIFKETLDGLTTLEMIHEYRPDILFLEIKMPELDGIGVLKSINVDCMPVIIIVTAFDQYALAAFEFDAIDYLLKPFSKERFNKAIQKAKRYLGSGDWKSRNTYVSRLTIKTGNKTILLPVDEVDYFQASESYVSVMSGNNSFLITSYLYELEKLLNPETFIRIHRSTIVNIDSIRTITSIANDSIVILKNGKEVRVSRNYKEKFLAALCKRK